MIQKHHTQEGNAERKATRNCKGVTYNFQMSAPCWRSDFLGRELSYNPSSLEPSQRPAWESGPNSLYSCHLSRARNMPSWPSR